jgi:hypothetical protein
VLSRTDTTLTSSIFDSQGPEGDTAVELHGRVYPAVELLSYIAERAKKNAGACVGDTEMSCADNTQITCAALYVAHSYIHTYRQTDRQTDKHRQTDRQAQAERHTNR